MFPRPLLAASSSAGVLLMGAPRVGESQWDVVDALVDCTAV